MRRTLTVLAIAAATCGVYPPDTQAQEEAELVESMLVAVEPAFAACYTIDDWQAQEERRGDDRAWIALMRTLVSEGRCWITAPRMTVEVVGDSLGALRIRVPESPKLAWWISREAFP